MLNLQDILLDIANKAKDIVYKLGLIADYVIETDTSGIWTYRKWNSGNYECWTSVSQSVSVNCNVGYLGGYGAVNGLNLSFPITFKDYPHAVVTGSGNNIVGTFVHTWSTLTGLNSSPVGTTSGWQSFGYNAFVRGRWK